MSPACGHCGQLHEPYVTMCPITGARLASASYTMVNDDEALVGNVVGERYDVRDILGQGSTGTVFGVVHMQFSRAFAMKVLRPRFTTMDMVHRIFHGEARAAFSIAHPSLCEVFDVGTLPDGAPFIVMERLEGDTLAARLGRERFSIAAAVDMMMQLLSAMDAVHSRELAFRDLRPQNIFLAQRRGCRPVLKILDFGLSRLIPLERIAQEWDALRAVAGPNDSSGSLSIPYYLSPERTRGEHGIDATSDIFIAGSIFYEALTGQKPFSGPSWNVLLHQIAQATPTPLSALRPEVPTELDTLVMRALSGKPRSRPTSARDMQDELRAVFEGPRRGSASMRSVPISTADSSAHTPMRADRRSANLPAFAMPASVPVPSSLGHRSGETSPPSAHATDRPPAEDPFDDETRTDRQRIDVNAGIVSRDIADEASADHPIRTVRPPGPPPGTDIEIDVLVEHEAAPATSRAGDLSHVLGLAMKGVGEEEETQTMQLTPEVRARIARMKGGTAPASSVEDSNRPPPTRRLTKPPNTR
jgi:eukaryotic-like serine/threonine-protein kinase